PGEENPRLRGPARQRRQRIAPVGFGKVLHRAALDDDVERTGTHRAVPQVTSNKFYAAPGAVQRGRDETRERARARLIGPGNSHGYRRNVEGGDREARGGQGARLLPDTIA